MRKKIEGEAEEEDLWAKKRIEGEEEEEVSWVRIEKENFGKEEEERDPISKKRTGKRKRKKVRKKSGKYWGQRRKGWAGAVMAAQLLKSKL